MYTICAVAPVFMVEALYVFLNILPGNDDVMRPRLIYA